MRPTPDDYAEARRLLAAAIFDGAAAGGPAADGYWNETAHLVMEYFELQAGALYSETLHEGFVGWLERSPAEFRHYENGDDMTRAALVDWFLRVVR